MLGILMGNRKMENGDSEPADPDQQDASRQLPIVLPMPNGSDVMKMQAMEITSNAPTVAVMKKGN